jgi:hypothetical protein
MGEARMGGMEKRRLERSGEGLKHPGRTGCRTAGGIPVSTIQVLSISVIVDEGV